MANTGLGKACGVTQWCVAVVQLRRERAPLDASHHVCKALAAVSQIDQQAGLEQDLIRCGKDFEKDFGSDTTL